VVHGSHDKNHVKPHEKGLEIEAALAFGTGHHGTTRGCLQAYWDVTRREAFASILDVGTGTGVLAMAAAKWHKVPVLATDIDPEAIRTARANAKANGCPQVRFLVCPGLCHPDVSKTTYDLIFANILKRPLMLLANDITKALKPGGVLILSGLLVQDAPWVISIYRGMGFRLEKRTVDEGWVTLVMRGTHKARS
jgi:ribosomal protein L11 methyltransferase